MHLASIPGSEKFLPFNLQNPTKRLKIYISGRPVRIDVVFNWSGFYVGKTLGGRCSICSGKLVRFFFGEKFVHFPGVGGNNGVPSALTYFIIFPFKGLQQGGLNSGPGPSIPRVFPPFEPRKKPWLVGLYKGLYYPIIWGL